MKKMIMAVLIGGAALAASSAAMAHIDVAIGVGVPGPVYVAPPPPVIYAPQPAVVAYPGYYGYGGGGVERWREHEWHRHEGHEHHDHGHRGGGED
jgi:hypothetical protein